LGFVPQPNLQSHVFTKAGTHNVTVTVTDNDGASTTKSIQVTVTNLAPTINTVNIPTNINEGSTVQLTATASDAGNDTLTYNWYINGATTPIIGQTIDYNFANSGSYPVKLEVIDSNGAITTQTVDVTINNLAPTINQIIIPTNIKEGETIQLQTTASDAGNDALIYNWYINGATTPIIGQTIDYKFPNNGIYPVRLDVIDSDGAITTQTIDVTVKNVAPTIDNITIPTNIKEGETVQLTATASDSGNDTLTYNWYLNNATTPITGQSIDYIFTDNGTYPVKLEVIDTDGAVTTQTVDVTVTNIAPTIVNIVKPTTINEGESVTFSATVTDPGVLDTLTYGWNFGDNTNPIIGQNVNHTFADNGTYNIVLTVTDKDGGVTTQTVVVKVDNVAPVVVSISKPNTIKEGELITFSATATDAGINDTLTYSWNFGDNTNPVLGQNVNHIFADNGNYNVTLTVTDRDSGVITESVAVMVDNVAPTVVSILQPSTIKEGESVTFSATASDPGILDILTYSWNFGDNTSPVTGQNATHTFADNGNYNVTLTVTDKDGASTTQTVVAKVDNVAPTIVNIIKPTTIKEGESAIFAATANDPGILDTLTYVWNFGDNTTAVSGQNVNHTFADNGNYNVTLTVTDKDGGVTTQTVVAKVDNVAPTVVSIAKPPTIKEGESVTFSATVTDPGILDTLTYSWNFGDNTTLVTGQNVNHTFADNGNYNVVLTVTDKDGAITQQSISVTVDNVAPIVVSIAGADGKPFVKPNTIKEGESVTFIATATDAGINDTLTYSWNFGDNTNPVIGQNVNHTFADNGNYNVVLTVTDKDGAITTETIIVKVDNVAPIITNITIPPEIKTYTPATFTATATDVGIADILTYTWNFGDGTNPVVGQNSSHTFTNPGTYNISLTVTDNDGGTSITTIQTITVLSKGIRAGGTVTINGSANLDGNINSRTDDTQIYAGKGVNLNGNVTLAVKRDAAGNPLRDAAGKLILVDNAITLANGATTNSNPSQYTNINIATQTITIPTYTEINQQNFSVAGTAITYDINQNPIKNTADWLSKFPPAGTISHPTVVRIVNGNFSLPANINLSNYIIIVENGNIDFNKGNPLLNNVTLIANNGNINFNSITATNLKLSATGNINFTGNTNLGGNILLNSNGNTTLGGNTQMTATSQLKLVSQGDVSISGNTTVRGQILTKKNLSISGKTTLVGSVDASGDVSISGNSTITAV
jgi:large repetitive protein